MTRSWLHTLIISLLFLSLTACFGGTKSNTVDNASKKQNPTDVETLLSQTIFLRPTIPGERSVYIKFTSTADKPVDLEGLQKELQERLRAKGYRISAPENANFLLQINLLSISKTSKSLTKEAVSNGFGAALAVASAAAGPAGSVVGAATESAGSLFFRDTYFNLITDIQLSERTPRINLIKSETHTDAEKWQQHTTRALSSAKDLNANQDECIDLLEENLLRVLNGIL
jgi:hypothetical protein